MNAVCYFWGSLLVLSLHVSASAATLYVATDGNDRNAGTIEAPFATLQKAEEVVAPGDTVYIRGGTYRPQPDQIARRERIWAHVFLLNKSGTADKPIRYWAYKNERPVFDFSDIKPPNMRVHAFNVNGSWLHFRGLEVVGVQVTIRRHTQSICFANNGSHNIYERLSMHDGQAIGIYSVRGGHNLFLNCDAYRNYDHVSEGGRGGNVDGFGCHPPKGATGNVFRGCRAWFNSDDGFDCISASEAVRFENCWAFYNGYTSEFVPKADGNGFKIGGFGSTPVSRLPRPIPRHVVQYCVAVKNKNAGFYGNHHIGGSDWFHNTAFANGTNFNMLSRLPDNQTDVPGYGHVLRNNLSFGARKLIANLNQQESDAADNTFTSDISVTEGDFVSLDQSQLMLPRSPAGDLPEMTFMHLAAGSPLIDGGHPMDLPYNGGAPDYGAFETAGPSSDEQILSQAKPSSETMEASAWHFQFAPGTASEGWTQVPGDCVYSDSRGYGLEPGSSVTVVDPVDDAAPHRGGWTSESPFFFSANVPPGNYRVTVTLGDPHRPSSTTVKAELRRLMLENITTAPGQVVRRSFIVNVRTPQIPGGGEVRRKQPRETVDEAWAWDRRLTLEFNGDAICIRSLKIEPVDVPTLFLLGDSTVCDQPHEPYASWGQMLPRFFGPTLAVANHAESGESLRSSAGAGRLDKVLAEIQPGDFVMLQFGHNDMKSKAPDASAVYARTLVDWVQQLTAKQATVLLVTPVRRYRFRGTQVVDSLLDYPARVREVAKQEAVAVIDLNAISKTLYETLGPEKAALLFKHDFVGDPKFDATHHSPYGAYELARCVIAALRVFDHPLTDHIAEEVPAYDPAMPGQTADFAVPPSPVWKRQRPLGD